MDQAQQAQAVQAIITNIVQTIAIIAPLAASGTFGAVEFAKKVGLSSRWAGLLSYAVGFGVSVVMMGLLTKTFFSPLSVLIGVMVAFGTPGVYSGVKSAVTTPQVQ